MVETQLAQIATAIPVDGNGKIPAQPEKSRENVKAVATRGGKTTRNPPIPNQSIGKEKECQEDEPSTKEKEKEKEEVTTHLSTSSTPATCCSLQGTTSKPWMSSSLVLLR
jgi:hypothetical protein